MLTGHSTFEMEAFYSLNQTNTILHTFSIRLIDLVKNNAFREGM